MSDGICPFAKWIPTTAFGYPEGTLRQNKPYVFVDHIMGGYKHTLDTPGWLASAGVSVHFGIGTDGSLSQYVNILDAAWGNGLVGQSPAGDRSGINRYNRANSNLAKIEQEAQTNWHTVYIGDPPQPKWTMSINGANAWNCRSISIEHEGLDQTIAWTQAMIDTDVKVKKWCNEELQRLGYEPIRLDSVGIIGHCDIDDIDRHNCPGSGRPLDTIIQLLGAEEMRTEKQNISDFLGNNKFNNGQPLVGRQYVNAAIDFELPPEAKYAEIEFMARGGIANIISGNNIICGQLGWGYPPQTASREHCTVALSDTDPNGNTGKWFSIDAFNKDNPLYLLMVRSIAYYT